MAELLPRVEIGDIEFAFAYDKKGKCYYGWCGWFHPHKDIIVKSQIFPLLIVDNIIPEKFINHKKGLLKSSINKDPCKMIYGK